MFCAKCGENTHFLSELKPRWYSFSAHVLSILLSIKIFLIFYVTPFNSSIIGLNVFFGALNFCFPLEWESKFHSNPEQQKFYTFVWCNHDIFLTGTSWNRCERKWQVL
jgi:hypothetical protein